MFIDHGLGHVDRTRSDVHSTFIESRSVDVRRYRMSARVSSESTKCTLHSAHISRLFIYLYSNRQYKHLVHFEINDTVLLQVCVRCARQSVWCVSILLSND